MFEPNGSSEVFMPTNNTTSGSNGDLKNKFNMINALNTNINLSLFDFMIIIFYIVFGTCMCSLVFAFRAEIITIIKRIMELTGFMPYWLIFIRNVPCFRSCYHGEEGDIEVGKAKVNYEIYNP